MRPDGAYTAVIFDLGGVQYTGLPAVEQLIRAEIEPRFRFSDSAGTLDDLILGQITEDAFWRSIEARYGWGVPLSNVKAMARRGFVEIPGTRPIIESLRQHGYRLGLLSNQASEWHDYFIAAFDYHDRFDAASYSFEDGVAKPDPAAYRLILARLGVSAREAVYVDDRPELVEAARRIGLAGVRFESAEQLRHDLRGLGFSL